MDLVQIGSIAILWTLFVIFASLNINPWIGKFSFKDNVKELIYTFMKIHFIILFLFVAAYILFVLFGYAFWGKSFSPIKFFN